MLQPLLTFEPDQAEWHEVIHYPRDTTDLQRLIREAEDAAGDTEARYVVHVQGQPGDGCELVVRFADEAAKKAFVRKTITTVREMSRYVAGQAGLIRPKD